MTIAAITGWTLQEDKLEQQINQTVEALVRQHNGSQANYQETLEAYNLYENRLEQLWASIQKNFNSIIDKTHTELCLLDLEKVYENLLHLRLTLEDFKEKWDRSYARLERVT